MGEDEEDDAEVFSPEECERRKVLSSNYAVSYFFLMCVICNDVECVNIHLFCDVEECGITYCGMMNNVGLLI